MPPDELNSNLAGFVSFAQSLKGNEKSESQSFLDQFFGALSHNSPIDAGATFEFRVAKKPTRKQMKAGAEAAIALRVLRRETMRKLKHSLRDPYRTLEQPGDNPLREAHVRLDAALAFLLDPNLALAAKEKAGEKITPPGLPLPVEERASFITDDCIQPPKIS